MVMVNNNAFVEKKQAFERLFSGIVGSVWIEMTIFSKICFKFFLKIIYPIGRFQRKF